MVFFRVIGLGYILSNLRTGSFSISSVAGVLFIGLIFSYFDFRISGASQMVGFALFIFSVGYQAGSGFVAVLKQDGLKYFVLSVMVASTGFWTCHTLGQLPLFASGYVSWIACRRLDLFTNPCCRAGCTQFRCGDHCIGWTKEQVIDNVAMGYAVTYIFGLVGLIMVMKYMPVMLKIDLVQETKNFERGNSENYDLPENVVLRTYRITNPEIESMPLEELTEKYWDKTSVVEEIYPIYKDITLLKSYT